MSKYLVDDRPLIILPGLVKLLGSEGRAIVLQQIHWLLEQPKSGAMIDGEKWVYGSYQEWCDDYFSMWSPDTLARHIRNLEKEGYLLSTQAKATAWDRTKYYRINYDKMQDQWLQKRTIDDRKSAPSMPAEVPPSMPAEVRDLNTETTSETCAETSKKTTTDPATIDAGKSSGRRLVDADFAAVCGQYESDFGMLTPTLAVELAAQLDQYGKALLLDAMRIAVLSNKRTLRYVGGILANWQREGKQARRQPAPVAGEGGALVAFLDPFSAQPKQEIMPL